VKSIPGLPNDKVIDGEIVSLDQKGRPSLNLLQGFGNAQATVFYAFGLMLRCQQVRQGPLQKRQESLSEEVRTLPNLIRYSEVLQHATVRIGAGCAKLTRRMSPFSFLVAGR